MSPCRTILLAYIQRQYSHCAVSALICHFRHAGVLFGITNTLATIPGMVAPIVAGLLTPNVSEKQSRNIYNVHVL